MYLAMDKFGRLGRKIKTLGDANGTAVVAAPDCASPTVNVYANPNQIAAQNNYWNLVDQAASLAKAQSDAQSQSSAQIASQAWTASAKDVDSFQNMVPENMSESALKDYLIQCVNTPQSTAVAKSISPNFNINALAPGKVFSEPTQNPNSDFNIFELAGNPLTRNGVYGVMTDWDVFVKGQEMTGAEIHSGNSNSTCNPSASCNYPVPTLSPAQKAARSVAKAARLNAGPSTPVSSSAGITTQSSSAGPSTAMSEDDSQEISSMNGGQSTVLYKHPRFMQLGRMGSVGSTFGDDGDDSDDYNALPDVTDSTPGSSASDYNALPDAPATATQPVASTTPAAASSGVNTTSLLQSGLTDITGLLSSALKTTTPTKSSTVLVSPSAASTTVMGIPTSIFYIGLAIVAAGGVWFMLKRK